MKIEHCEFPDDVLYDLERWTWGRPQGETLRLGITSLLSWSYGTFSAVTFKEVGTAVVKGQVIGSVDGSRHFDVIRAPVSGTLSKINGLLSIEPELLNKDPYGEGWFAEIQMINPDDLKSLGRLPEAGPDLARQVRERNVRCFAAFPDLELFDAGAECAAVLVKLNETLGNSKPGTVVHVVSDDTGSEAEMRRWSDVTGNAILDYRKEGNFNHYIVQKKR